MPKVTEQHREARRDQIVDAALRCFARTGFQRTSMADIIAEAGLSAGAIYGHFTGKQQLALAVARRILGNRLHELGERTRAGEDLPAPSAMLRFMMTGLAGDVRDVGVLVQLWGEAVTDPEMSTMIGPIFAEVRNVMGPYLAGWAVERRGLSPDAAAAWADDLVPVFLGLGQGYIIQSTLLPGFDADGYFRAVASLLDGPSTGDGPAFS
jgi:TetR/AcrR family transcriptional regulator, transcriptional repressor of aconitase